MPTAQWRGKLAGILKGMWTTVSHYLREALTLVVIGVFALAMLIVPLPERRREKYDDRT